MSIAIIGGLQVASGSFFFAPVQIKLGGEFIRQSRFLNVAVILRSSDGALIEIGGDGPLGPVFDYRGLLPDAITLCLH